jgi:hypothetical protein
MAHIYMLFEFAKDEEKAQQARHKLETWKQAFRLDKKLIYKLERTPVAAIAGAAPGDNGDDEKPAKVTKAKGKGRSAAKAGMETETEATPASNEDIRLIVRLGFSGHEKLSEQRWVDRIPMEEPFREASPVVVKPGELKFEDTEKQFEDLA